MPTPSSPPWLQAPPSSFALCGVRPGQELVLIHARGWGLEFINLLSGSRLLGTRQGFSPRSRPGLHYLRARLLPILQGNLSLRASESPEWVVCFLFSFVFWSMETMPFMSNWIWDPVFSKGLRESCCKEEKRLWKASRPEKVLAPNLPTWDLDHYHVPLLPLPSPYF